MEDLLASKIDNFGLYSNYILIVNFGRCSNNYNIHPLKLKEISMTCLTFAQWHFTPICFMMS